MRFIAISLSLITLSDFLLGAALSAEPIPVRYEQGSSHGFLALKTLDGATIATGEATQVVSRGKVTSRLIFRFKDGSVDDDVTVFTQNKVFRLLTDHHIQHGPSFQADRLPDRHDQSRPYVQSGGRQPFEGAHGSSF